MVPTNVYRVSKGWKVFFSFLMVVAVIVFGGVAGVASTTGFYGKRESGWFFLSLAGAFLGFAVYGFLAVMKSCVEVAHDRIRYRTLFNVVELPFSLVRGFRVQATKNESVLHILPKEKTAKKIKITLILECKEELLKWMDQHFTNLDEQDIEEELDRILDDARLGTTEDERLMKLSRVKKWAIAVNGLGVIVALWGFFYPRPYPYAMGALLLVPLLALVSVHYSEGVLKLDGKKNSAYPNVGLAIFLPCVALTLRGFMDYSILCWSAFWLPFATGIVFFFCGVLVLVKDIRCERIQIGMALLFCGMYAYASVINLNGILDSSKPIRYEVHVLEKRISKGSKHTSYYLMLSPWGSRKEHQEVDVGKRVYQKHEVGDSATVVVKSGKLNIPWYYVK